ncbi:MULTISPECIES: glutathione S-transferase [Prochlorococcus]|uniref:Glutathione S-transferase n=1 Tax=Prochlorococcus marinus str. MIT 9116 TaxID=167544 RepID=A0A0A1ZNY4_PROMR|nr:glutathione S-transferase [Prochlorococcus marinus]KGF89188.1 Glutathione S-transferase [Prochlorococcus marinus str. MIT 9107]KGF89944.1 Glutathione S-transferase [Prochlorococcus marinus str. MIT 9116]KGF95379.1 Glutathione S-transferase [Prochlorococcus marinus str. MIT 9123]
MQNKYLIKASKKFWFWYWKQLMNGFAPSDIQGNYKRPKGITIDSEYNISNENRQIYLLVGNSCPWCQRTLLVHEIKHLSKKVKVIFLKADIENGEWVFNKNFKGFIRLSDLYKKANKKIIFRATLPLLISFGKDKVNILSNESSQIIRLLNTINSSSKHNTLKIKDCNQELLDLIHNNINDGVYRCGFARNQSSYEKASKNLFAALNEVENSLQKNKADWICGEELTYADIYLFPTLIRWELIYSILFKCTEQELSKFQKIIEWRLKFFKLSNVYKTCYDDQWKKDYYKALFPLNPNQLIPVLPSLKEIMRLES